jgi:EamA domain-containing membrane protein RarD
VVWDEPWSGGQAVGFIIIWLALIAFATEPIKRQRDRTAVS